MDGCKGEIGKERLRGECGHGRCENATVFISGHRLDARPGSVVRRKRHRRQAGRSGAKTSRPARQKAHDCLINLDATVFSATSGSVGASRGNQSRETVDSKTASLVAGSYEGVG